MWCCGLQFLSSCFAAANRYNYAGTLVWAAHANVPETTFLLSNGTWGYEGYNFLYSQVRYPNQHFYPAGSLVFNDGRVCERTAAVAPVPE